MVKFVSSLVLLLYGTVSLLSKNIFIPVGVHALANKSPNIFEQCDNQFGVISIILIFSCDLVFGSGFAEKSCQQFVIPWDTRAQVKTTRPVNGLPITLVYHV